MKLYIFIPPKLVRGVLLCSPRLPGWYIFPFWLDVKFYTLSLTKKFPKKGPDELKISGISGYQCPLPKIRINSVKMLPESLVRCNAVVYIAIILICLLFALPAKTWVVLPPGIPGSNGERLFRVVATFLNLNALMLKRLPWYHCPPPLLSRISEITVGKQSCQNRRTCLDLDAVAAPLMTLHVASYTKGLATASLRALERLLTGVRVAMNAETARPAESLVASLADIAIRALREQVTRSRI